MEYPGNRLTKDAGTCRFSWPPYLRDEKCWSYTKGRKPKEMLTVRIWPKSTPNLAIYSNYEQNYTLPDDVDKTGIAVKVENGILTVIQPKVKKEEKKLAKAIEIS